MVPLMSVSTGVPVPWMSMIMEVTVPQVSVSPEVPVPRVSVSTGVLVPQVSMSMGVPVLCVSVGVLVSQMSMSPDPRVSVSLRVPVPPVSMFRGLRSHACPCPVSGRPLAGAPRHIPAPHRLLVPLGGSPRGEVCTPRGGGKGVKRDVVTLNPGVPQAQPQAGGSQEQRAACEQHSNYRKNTAVGAAACHLEGDSSRGARKELTCL